MNNKILNQWLGCVLVGFDWVLNLDVGYDGQDTSRRTSRSITTNEKLGIDGPKVNGRINPLQKNSDTGHHAVGKHCSKLRRSYAPVLRGRPTTGPVGRILGLFLECLTTNWAFSV